MLFAGKLIKYSTYEKMLPLGPRPIEALYSGFAIGIFVTLSFTYISEVRYSFIVLGIKAHLA
jgi:hypothetical protein